MLRFLAERMSVGKAVSNDALFDEIVKVPITLKRRKKISSVHLELTATILKKTADWLTLTSRPSPLEMSGRLILLSKTGKAEVTPAETRPIMTLSPMRKITELTLMYII